MILHEFLKIFNTKVTVSTSRHLKYFVLGWLQAYQVVVVVVKRREGVFEDVWCVSQKNQRKNSSIHSVGVIHPLAQHRILPETIQQKKIKKNE